MAFLKKLDWVALIVLIVGGINWGLVGLFDLDVVKFLLAESIIAKIVYVIVGLSAIYTIYLAARKKI